MPLCSTSARSTTAEEEAEVKAAVGRGEATNNQPGMASAGRVHHNPHVHPLPSSITKIGTTVYPWW
jgi:hypothetical protein